ncbi:MAG: hypothetical protein ACI4QR_04215 [Eubacteriales bacterium]
MKKLLKAVSFICAFCLSLSLFSCAKNNNDNGTSSPTDKAFSEMTLEEILDAVLENGEYSNFLTSLINAPAADEESGVFKNHLVTTVITKENAEGYIGTSDIDFEYAIASEAAMNPTTYLFCLVRLKDGGDASAAAQLIQKSANPSRWVCTGVSPEHVYTDFADNVVILIMSDTDGTALLSSFRSVAGK